MKTNETPRTREFLNGNSCFNLINGKPYFKKIHFNGNEVSLSWHVNQEPMFGSKYYPINDAPAFIKRNLINLNAIAGKTTIEVVDYSGRCVQQLSPALFTNPKSVIECLKSWGDSYSLVITDYQNRITKGVVYEN